MQKKTSSPLTEKSEPPSPDTEEQGKQRRGEDWMTVGKSQLYKNRQTLPRGVGGLLLGALLPSFLQYLIMSGASVLAGAHHFVASNNNFYTANTVRDRVIV